MTNCGHSYDYQVYRSTPPLAKVDWYPLKSSYAYVHLEACLGVKVQGGVPMDSLGCLVAACWSYEIWNLQCSLHVHDLALYPGSLGRGKKEPGICCLHNYLTFQSFWISPGTSTLCWRHQPISRTLNFTLKKWIARFRTLLNTSAVLLWLWKMNKLLASRPSMKERMYFSGCLQVLACQCAMKYCPLYLMTS